MFAESKGFESGEYFVMVILMKTLTTLATVLFISLLSSPSWSEAVNMRDLVERNDLWYKQFSDVPFTGEVSGLANGKIKNGKKNGPWKWYWQNGQLRFLSSYKNGIDHGIFEDYSESGELKSRMSFKDGLLDGISEHYFSNGKLKQKVNYKDHNRDGILETYHENGQLKYRWNYKDGKMHGLQKDYAEDGSLSFSIKYENGVYVPD